MSDPQKFLASLHDSLRLTAEEKKESREILASAMASQPSPAAESAFAALRAERLTPTESAAARAALTAAIGDASTGKGNKKRTAEELLASLSTSFTLSETERGEHRELLKALSGDSRTARLLSAEDLQLHPIEKSLVRAELIRKIEGRRMPVRQQVTIGRFVLSRSLATVFAAFVLLFVSGGAFVSAAESTIPGDFLYGFKTGVNEKVLAAFRSDASWSLRKVERRLEEAQVAAGRATLTGDQEKDVIAAIGSAFDDAERASTSDEELTRLRELRREEFDNDPSLPSEKKSLVKHLADIRRIQTRGIVSKAMQSEVSIPLPHIEDSTETGSPAASSSPTGKPSASLPSGGTPVLERAVPAAKETLKQVLPAVTTPSAADPEERSSAKAETPPPVSAVEPSASPQTEAPSQAVSSVMGAVSSAAGTPPLDLPAAVDAPADPLPGGLR